MNSSFLTLIDLIYPFLLGGFVLALQFFIRGSENDVTKFQFSVFGFVTFESAMRKLWLVRSFLFLIALGLFSLSAFRDYGEFFPTHMQLEVFFDDEGIDKALRQFDQGELQGLNLATDWKVRKRDHVASLNRVLEGMKHPFRFDVQKSAVRSRGENRVEVERDETWGWQHYRLVDSRGSVTHTYEIPGHDPQTITSTFELLETDANHFDLSLREIYFGWTKVIRPEYKQKFSRTQTDVFYSHNLVSLTKVRFFPYIDIGKSVYLAKDPSSEQYIPVGYAIYYPD